MDAKRRPSNTVPARGPWEQSGDLTPLSSGASSRTNPEGAHPRPRRQRSVAVRSALAGQARWQSLVGAIIGADRQVASQMRCPHTFALTGLYGRLAADPRSAIREPSAGHRSPPASGPTAPKLAYASPRCYTHSGQPRFRRAARSKGGPAQLLIGSPAPLGGLRFGDSGGVRRRQRRTKAWPPGRRKMRKERDCWPGWVFRGTAVCQFAVLAAFRRCWRSSGCGA